MNTILSLPDEDIICRFILCYLSLKDLIIIKRVNKVFHSISTLYLKKYCHVYNFSSIGGLKSFKIYHFQNIVKEKNNISNISFKNCKSWLNDECLIPVIKANQELTYLHLEECYLLTDQLFFIIGDYLLKLEYLDLSFCRALSAEALTYIGENLKNLKYLNVTGCWNVNDMSIEVIAMNNENLEEILMASCYSLTDYCIKNVSKNCRDLRTLDIQGCWRIKDTSIIAITEYCKQLKELYVKDCTSITEISLARLRPRNVKIDRRKPYNFVELGERVPYLQI